MPLLLIGLSDSGDLSVTALMIPTESESDSSRAASYS